MSSDEEGDLSQEEFVVDEDLQDDYRMDDDYEEYREGMLEQMAYILDKQGDPRQSSQQKPSLVDQIEEAKKARYLEQVSKIQHLKVTSQENQLLIAKQNEQIAQLEQQLLKDERVNQTLDDQIKYQESQGKALSEDSKKSLQNIQDLSDKYDKVRKTYNESVQAYTQVENENNTLKKDVDNWKKSLKQLQQDTVKKDQRLAKLQEELVQVRMTSKEEQLQGADQSEELSKQFDKLSGDNKRLLKQRSEVVALVKKQAKLIEVLRKQKMHLETCSSLQLSEQEFMKAVDLQL